MGAGNFFSGLLGGYTGSLVKNEARQYEQDLASKEFRIHSAVTAMDAAMKSGDKNAMDLASKNLDEAIGSLQDIGKKKPKQKKDSPHAGLLQSIIGAIGGGGGQQGQQQAPSLGQIPKMPGVAQGAGGMPRDPGMSAGAPPSSTAIPPMPQRPTSLGDVYAALPSPEQQAATAGRSNAAETGARFEALKKQAEQNLGRPLKPEEGQMLWAEVSKVLPTNLSQKPTLLTERVPITAAEAPPNAITADGKPVSSLDPKQHVSLWQYPDGRILAFPAGVGAGTSGVQATKVNSINGIPSSISGHGQTYPINSPDMPDDLKPIAAQAIKDHARAMQEKATDEVRRSNMLATRAIDTLFGLLPGESLYTKAKGIKGSAPSAGKASKAPSISGTNENFLKTLNPKVSSLVREIGTGKMPLERMGYLLTRNPSLASMVAQAYPDFDGSKVQAYISTVKDFTSGKTSIALNAGATALKHMEELMKLNTMDSRIPGTADSKAFHNKLDTVVGELVRFYQMPSTNQSYDSMKGTLGGIFNRDAAIRSQINSMADKLASYAQQWQNAAPSSAYEAPMPHIDEKAKKALFAIDPNFASDYPDIAGIFSPKTAAAGSKNEIRVQIPGHPPGVIPKSALGAFKKQYPDAQVIQ